MLFLVVSLIISNLAQAETPYCPSTAWASHSNIQACPTSGSTILPENYPALAYVISDQPSGSFPSESARSVPEKMILSILTHSNPDQLPLILFPSSEASWERVQHAIHQATRGQPQLRKKYLSTLRKVPQTSSYTWQQDYFESFFDPKSGLPVVRGYDAYFNSFNGIQRGVLNDLIQSANQGCRSFQSGSDLKYELLKKIPRQNSNAGAGGNIEGLPGGLCLFGNKQTPEYARQYCAPDSNHVQIDTSWLRVGHVDEIIHVHQNPKAKPPCNFTLSITSPALALDLLKKNSNQKFFQFFSNTPLAPDTENEFRARMEEYPLNMFCADLRDFLKNKTKEQSPGFENSPDHVPTRVRPAAKWIPDFQWLIQKNAYADIVVKKKSDSFSFDCKEITNGEVAEFLDSSQGEIAKLNRKIQQSLEDSQKAISEKIKKRLPQCQIDWVLLPNIYGGGNVVELDDGNTTELPYGKIHSILPNMTNGLNVGEDAYIAPHPHHASFAQYTELAFRQAGIQTLWVDSWKFAHIGGGNIHCATHQIPVCRPSTHDKKEGKP